MMGRGHLERGQEKTTTKWAKANQERSKENNQQDGQRPPRKRPTENNKIDKDRPRERQKKTTIILAAPEASQMDGFGFFVIG